MSDAARAHALNQGWADKAGELLAYLDSLLDTSKGAKRGGD